MPPLSPPPIQTTYPIPLHQDILEVLLGIHLSSKPRTSRGCLLVSMMGVEGLSGAPRLKGQVVCLPSTRGMRRLGHGGQGWENAHLQAPSERGTGLGRVSQAAGQPWTCHLGVGTHASRTASTPTAPGGLPLALHWGAAWLSQLTSACTVLRGPSFLPNKPSRLSYLIAVDLMSQET